jgi:hypothetical protein
MDLNSSEEEDKYDEDGEGTFNKARRLPNGLPRRESSFFEEVGANRE